MLHDWKREARIVVITGTLSGNEQLRELGAVE